MKKNTYITNLNQRTSLVERTFCHEGNDYVEIFAYDKLYNMIEYLGTSYGDMQYYYSSDYIVFVKDEDVEFAFDTTRFCFITNEVAKMRAFNKILRSSKIDFTKEESDLEIEEEERYMIKKYYIKK